MKLKITAYHRGMLYPCYGGMPNVGIAMHHREEYENHDEPRGRFAIWLENVVRNSKINYIKKLKRQPPALYPEEIPESALPVQNLVADVYTKSEFEEKRLAEVFSRLPLMRNRILTRNFIHKTVHDTYYIFTLAY